MTHPRRRRKPNPRARGAAALALLLVMCSVAAMMGALAIRGAVADLRIAGAQKASKVGFYCAEAGLHAARNYFAAQYGQWGSMFSAGQGAPLGYPVTGDLDGDGRPDFEVRLRDNVDEFPPLANDPLRDNDLTAIMVSRCINPAMGPRQMEEIILCNQHGTNYRSQAGHGSNHAGNEN